MFVGIVGSEEKKFTLLGRQRAILLIESILSSPNVARMVSGHCHLGGIDIWAEEVASMMGIRPLIFPPLVYEWEKGYRPRNIQIAKFSNEVHCITVNRLPDNYDGMRFDSCYHCEGSGIEEHIKSGGCWTVRYAMKLGKRGFWHVINNEEGE